MGPSFGDPDGNLLHNYSTTSQPQDHVTEPTELAEISRGLHALCVGGYIEFYVI